MRRWIWLPAIVLIAANPAEAAVKLERIPAEQAPVEERIASGQGVFWTLDRRAIAHRGQTLLDGVIIVSPESGLKLKAIRRADGDQQVVLGPEGKEGAPVADLSARVKEMKREKMTPYRLDMGKEIAVVYVPHGATLRASQKPNGVMIELEIREDKNALKMGEDTTHNVGM